jgi:hypothetical protein
LTAIYRACFAFDAGSGRCLWRANDRAVTEFGLPIDPARLPISSVTRELLNDLCARYDTSMNWDYPPDPGPWRRSDCDRFAADVQTALRQLRTELGEQWQIVDDFQPVVEDPDLDRYLQNPQTFRR